MWLGVANPRIIVSPRVPDSRSSSLLVPELTSETTCFPVASRIHPVMANPNGDKAAPEILELSVKAPDNLVIPPLAVRESIAKTADYVRRRGDGILVQLKARVSADPAKSNVSFVMEDDPYNPYFVWFTQQILDGKGQTNQSAQQAIDNKPKGPPEPEKFRFSARMPNISAKDLDVLKSTALWTARVGENWLKELRNREAGNPQFEWLRPNHSFFQFFRSLVDQYKILLEEEQTVEARIEELQRNIKNRFHVLERAKGRAEYVKFVTAQKEKEEKKAEDEKKEYATIDWHEFTVIATVLFDEVDDNADLPPPALLNDLQSQSLEQKAMVSLSTRRLEEAMPDEQTYYNVNQYTAPQPVQPAYPMAPPVQAPYGGYVPPPQDYRSPAERAREEEQARRQAENDQRARAQAATRGAPGRIVTDYVPRAAAKKSSAATAVCPNCKQNIPANEIDEHIRSEYLRILMQKHANTQISRTSRSAMEGAARQSRTTLLDHDQHRRCREQPKALCQPARRYLRWRFRHEHFPGGRGATQEGGHILRWTAGPGQGRRSHGADAEHECPGTASQDTGETSPVSVSMSFLLFLVCTFIFSWRFLHHCIGWSSDHKGWCKYPGVEATEFGLDGATQWFGIVSTIDCSGKTETVKIGVRLSGRRI
jgi:splicing factor 3A subunit 1